MKKQLSCFLVLTLLAVTFLPAFAQAQNRTAADAAAIKTERQNARTVETTARELARMKEINERFREHYYTRVIPQIDAYSIDLYAAFLPVVRRLANVEMRMYNLIYNVMRSRGIALSSPAGNLPDGVVPFDVQDKFYNAQNCLDGRHYPNGNNFGSGWLNQNSGRCLLYDVPASGVAGTNTDNGLPVIFSPRLLSVAWENFSDGMASIPGGFNIGFGRDGNGGWSPPITLLPFLPPPFLPDGSARIIFDSDGNPVILPNYGPQSTQIVTGYASQCLNNVPARYFPNYYLMQNPNTPLEIEDVLALPLDVTISTPCNLLILLPQQAINILTDLLNDILNLNPPISSFNITPFPEYEKLSETIDQLPPWVAPPYPSIDYCSPLVCEFVDNSPFRFAVDLQIQGFKKQVNDMRISLEIIRQAYRALNYDILEALEYHAKTQ